VKEQNPLKAFLCKRIWNRPAAKRQQKVQGNKMDWQLLWEHKAAKLPSQSSELATEATTVISRLLDTLKQPLDDEVNAAAPRQLNLCYFIYSKQ
jgi:hypothetical protein